MHPIHSEAVDWIAALPDIGCTASLLVAFLFFVIARGGKSKQYSSKLRPVIYVLFLVSSLAAFAAALLWKETVVVFPLIVMAYVFCLGTDVAPLRRLRVEIHRQHQTAKPEVTLDLANAFIRGEQIPKS